MPTVSIAQAPRRASAVRPDYSQVTSLAAARALAAEGKLVKILLFPAELGGEDIPENVAYIPPYAAEARQLVIGTLRRFMADELIDKLEVVPEYRGESFVPTKLVMHATHSKKKGSLHPTVEIW
ncbi:hypothetical protein [Sphingomonas sp. 28-62-20]|uniref:hypothetical protein n=1 Tax=Sphingomonas sp. 28-62-20 TaxID=1970433 RepID=UPI0035A92084